MRTLGKKISTFALLVLFIAVDRFGFCNAIESFHCPNEQTVVEGPNEKWTTHGKVRRKFYADFPKVQEGTPVGVVFSWHGAGTRASEWRRRFPLADYSSSLFPFIVITPEDVGLKPIGTHKGFDWDLFISAAGDDNLEAKLFESILACLALTHPISPNHIYSAGFSAGAIVSNMLLSRYPQLIAAIFSGSGAWLNDPRQRELIHTPFGVSAKMDWPELTEKKHGAVLMTYGSQKDQVKAGLLAIMNFHDAALRTEEFLPRYVQTLLTCKHDNGHHLHPLISVDEVVRFFSAHTAGQPSPYQKQSQLPRFLSSICQLHATE